MPPKEGEVSMHVDLQSHPPGAIKCMSAQFTDFDMKATVGINLQHYLPL